jgi:hypothetical protein
MFRVKGLRDWWVGGGSSMPAARYIAQLTLGRRTRRGEWVTLIDGDPDNLDVSNIAITTAKQVARRRFGHPWTYTRLTDMRGNGGAA